MNNIYFPDEHIDEDDVKFVCYMIEKVARKTKNSNSYVVSIVSKNGFYHLLSCAKAMHCENPEKISQELIEEYKIPVGNKDFSYINKDLCPKIPTEMEIGKVYQRLICSTLGDNEDYADGICRVYADPICDIINDFNSSAYYEPPYIIEKAYFNGSF